MRKYVSHKILKSIYFAIFDSYLCYCYLVWAQNRSTIQRIVILQKKSVINFQTRNFHTRPLFKQNSILKFQDNICLENILFVSKPLNNVSSSVFNTWFSFSQINITMKPQTLHRVASKRKIIWKIDMGIIQ